LNIDLIPGVIVLNNPIVTTAWLERNLDNKKLILLDASMSKIVGKKPIVYTEAKFIPHSRRFDLEEVFCDLASAQNNAFPSPEHFTREARKLGINTDSLVVIYDNQGIYSSPRAWWIFQAMGFKNAVVLNGGLPQWLEEKRPTVSALSNKSIKLGNINGFYQQALVCDAHYVLQSLPQHTSSIVDARSAMRFSGQAPEPRAGVRSGHIPKALSLPFAEILDIHCFKSQQQLTEIFSKLGIQKNTQAIFTCGSGITACIIMLAAHIAGMTKTSLYDGSWADWGSNQSLPIEKHE